MANDIAQRFTALAELAKAIPESLLAAVDDPNSPGKKTKKLGFGTFLKTYNRSAAEISENLSNDDLDFKEDELHILRYGENPSPGTTNITTAFENAFAVAKAKASGGVIVAPPDIYLVDPLTITSATNITFIGNGSTLKAPASPTTGYALTFDSCDQIKVKGWEFDQRNSITSGQENNGIHLLDTTQFLAHDCDFSECWDGIIVGGAGGLSDEVTVQYCRMFGALDWSSANDSNKLICSFMLRTFSPGKGNTYCLFNRVKQVDHLFQPNTANGTCIGNICKESHDSAIYIAADNFEVLGNVCLENGKEGIKALASAALKNLTIVGNTVIKAAIHQTDGCCCIQLRANDSTVSANTIGLATDAETAASDQRGISLAGDGNVISGNTIRGSSPTTRFGRGITVQSISTLGGKDNDIFGNTVLDCREGYRVSGDPTVTFQDIDIHDNRAINCDTNYHVFATGNTARVQDIYFINNRSDKPANHGFLLTDTDKIHLDGNRSRNAGLRDYQFDGATDTEFVNNNSDGNAGAAFLLESGTVTYTRKHNNWNGTENQNFEILTANKTITAAENDYTFYLDAAGGFTVDLAAPVAKFKSTIIVKTAPTTAYIITTNAGANLLFGTFLDTIGELVYFSAQDTLNFVASVSVVGDRLEIESDGINIYCKAFSGADGGITVSVT